ncbi:MAG TPA: CDP-alcohol phosphatidyltransferase family protein [Micromonosporaceae bacterium]|nr:CDP-alcohol phosphatidyltransferase family protein [Micromonosporaceae bacterium]
MAKIFSASVRSVAAWVFDPVARALLRLGVSPNAVTVAGTLGVLVGAGLATQGWLLAGLVVVTLSALTDTVDGTMARMQPRPGRFGALLDSSMDRVADGAVFGAVAYWMAVTGDLPSVLAALVCLVAGQLVSYVKARAEGLGMTCDVGWIERLERLLIIGVGGLATGLGLDWGLPVTLWVLAALSVATAGQRIRHAYRQDRAAVEQAAVEQAASGRAASGPAAAGRASDRTA